MPTAKELIQGVLKSCYTGKRVDGVAQDMRDRLGLEHDDKGRFAKKSGGRHEGIALALKVTDQEKLKKVRAIGNYTTADGKRHDTRINNSTGKPISKELNDCIDALMCGIYVTDAEIEDTPEWKNVRATMKDFIRTFRKKNKVVYTDKIKTDARVAKRKAIEDKFMADTITAETNPDAFAKGDDTKPWKVKKGKEIFVITGLPAAGKSTTFANRLSVDNKARLIDSDEIKKQFDEFNHGLGADMVHQESSDIAKNVLQRSVKQGDNIVYPIIGHKPEKLEEMFTEIRKHGYRINLYLNEMETTKAKGRMLLRFAERGRFLPLKLFRKYKDGPTAAYNAVKGKTDHYEWYKSDTGLGEKPKEIEKGDNK